jgi:hypothetical protein
MFESISLFCGLFGIVLSHNHLTPNTLNKHASTSQYIAENIPGYTWHQANLYCLQEHGTTLANILSEDDNNAAIVAAIEADIDTSTFSVWIGLNDILSKDDPSVWLYPDGETTSYYDWNNNEPSISSDGEDCVHISWYDASGENDPLTGLESYYAWNDLLCSKTSLTGFICNEGQITCKSSSYLIKSKLRNQKIKRNIKKNDYKQLINPFEQIYNNNNNNNNDSNGYTFNVFNILALISVILGIIFIYKYYNTKIKSKNNNNIDNKPSEYQSLNTVQTTSV